MLSFLPRSALYLIIYFCFSLQYLKSREGIIHVAFLSFTFCLVHFLPPSRYKFMLTSWINTLYNKYKNQHAMPDENAKLSRAYVARLMPDDIFIDKIHVVVYVDVFHLNLAKYRGTIIRRGILRLRFMLYLERQLTYKQLPGSLIKGQRQPRFDLLLLLRHLNAAISRIIRDSDIQRICISIYERHKIPRRS